MPCANATGLTVLADKSREVLRRIKIDPTGSRQEGFRASRGCGLLRKVWCSPSRQDLLVPRELDRDS